MNPWERDEILNHQRDRRAFERQIMADYRVFRHVVLITWRLTLAAVIVAVITTVFLRSPR